MMLKNNNSSLRMTSVVVSWFLIVTTTLPCCWASTTVEGSIQLQQTVPFPPSNPAFRGGEKSTGGNIFGFMKNVGTNKQKTNTKKTTQSKIGGIKKNVAGFTNPIKKRLASSPTKSKARQKKIQQQKGGSSFLGRRGLMKNPKSETPTTSAASATSAITESLMQVWLTFVTYISKIVFQLLEHYIQPSVKVVVKYTAVTFKTIFKQLSIALRAFILFWTGKLSYMDYFVITTSIIGGCVSILSVLTLLADTTATTTTSGTLTFTTAISTPLAVACGIIFVPLCLIYQRQISKLQSYRTILNELRSEVNQMSTSNIKLAMNNNKLQQTTEKLKQAESDLKDISKTQELSLDQLVNLIDEYEQVQDDIELDLKYKVQQTLLSVLLRSDTDEDMIVDPEEMNRLFLRLESIPGVTFDRDQVEKALSRVNNDILKFTDRHLTYTSSSSSSSPPGLKKGGKDKKRKGQPLFEFETTTATTTTASPTP